MDLQWLKTMMITILSVGLCLVFTVTEAQISITINGSSSTNRTLLENDTMTITCTVPSNYTSFSNYQMWRDYTIYRNFGNSHTGIWTKTTTCYDNALFRCYARLNGKGTFSNDIYVTVNCAPPYWSTSVQQPVIFFLPSAVDTKVEFLIISHPRSTFSVQKFTSTGLQDLPPNIDVKGTTERVTFYFRTYSEDSHGVYQITATNSLGTLTTNITLRGLILPPKNLIAWSTTPTSINLEWTAGETFQNEPNYYWVYFKHKDVWGQAAFPPAENLTLYNLIPNTTYYYLARATHKIYGFSNYSNMAIATTLSPGDPPQTKPPIYQPVESTTSSPCVTTSQVPITSKPTSTPVVTSTTPQVPITSEPTSTTRKVPIVG